MNNIIEINEKKYEIIDDKDKSIDINEIEPLLTEYFDIFDYICGDYSYDKLRLKGFNDKNNKNFNNINDIATYDNYLKNICSYGCKHFLIKKIQ